MFPRLPLFLSIMLLLATACYSQQQFNMPLLSNWDDNNIPPAWTGAYSDCHGYASNGREYAFLGSTQGVYFFDITDPYTPRQVAFFASLDTVSLVVNKDFATYNHYLYAVSDQGENSLQIFDLQYLPDSVVKVYDSQAVSMRCHTVFVENDRLYMCSNTRYDHSFGAMDIMSLADPENPVLIGTLFHPGFNLVHEVHVKNDTAYCSNGTNGLWIYDVRNAATPSLISILDIYPEMGYNHSSWLTDDGKTMVFTDETHGTGIKLFDMTDIHDPQLFSVVRSNLLMEPDSLSQSAGSVAHIPYIVGNIMLVSYYHDGVIAYDISDRSHSRKVAHYDTYPENTNYYSYKGCWGLYPFLPSGHIIASDVTNGLFILDGANFLNTQPEDPVVESVIMGQNPVGDELQVTLNGWPSGKVTAMVFDVTGKLVIERSEVINQASFQLRIPLAQLAASTYLLKIFSEDHSFTSKLIKAPFK